jgi:environmental stress-induced protein Ves
VGGGIARRIPLPDNPGMTEINLISPADYRVMTWRNGQGTTTEIAIAPGHGDRFRWRLSIADVAASGPFSDFSGYDRIIAVVSGAGMRLAVAGRAAVVLTRDSEPYAFPGDAATECTLLDGPIRDFNLMTDRSSCRGAVAALRFAGRPIDQPLTQGATSLLHAVRGGLAVSGGASGGWQVPEGATLRLDGAGGGLTIASDHGGLALLASIDA